MRRSVLAIVMCLTIVSAAFSQSKKDAAELSRLEASVAELDSKIALTELELNRLTWEKFLERAENSKKVIDIYKIGGFDRNALCDTIPELKELDRRHKAADSAYLAVLRSDPEYQGIRSRWVEARGDETKRAQIQGEYNVLYDRLKKSNPEYTPLNSRRIEAKAALEIAIARRLLDYYHQRGEVMPTSTVGPRSEWNVIRTLGDIPSLTEDISLMKSTRKKIKQRINDVTYGLKQGRKAKDNPVSLF